MKKFISIVLIIVSVLSFTLAGCGENNDYVIQNDNVIKIGVILSQGEESLYGAKVLDGINYASSLASTVNMNGKNFIELSVYDINDDITQVATNLIEDKVAAVICAAESDEKAEGIVNAFDNYNTPLLFVDCYSDAVISDEESFVLSVPYSYQSSVVASYLVSAGLSTGAVIHSDDDHSNSFYSTFNNTFISSGGTNVLTYDNFDPKVVVSDEPQFVFIIGDSAYTKDVYSKLKSEGAQMPVVVTEVFNKTAFESTEYNDMLFVSKFEIDDKNYIGTDFFSVYSSAKSINKNDITAAEGYGYDAYMLIYGALMGFNSSISGDSSDSQNTDNNITTADVKSAITEIVHLGVTDSINFDSNGLVNTNFVYLSTIQNSQSVMLNRYDYSNNSAQ